MRQPDLPPEEAMTIGVFARQSRLSLKALRLYDDMGLLTPRHVDPNNGYRYYVGAQVDRARIIGHLRRLEMPLSEIAKVIDLPPQKAGAHIMEFWHGVEEKMIEKRRLVEFLTTRLTNLGGPMYTIATRSVPDQTVVTRQKHVVAGELPDFISDAMSEIFSVAGPTVEGAPFVIYHGQVDTDSDGPVEVCVPVSGDAAEYDPGSVRTEPAHREAYARITKGEVKFPKILEAYEAVEKWTERENIAITDSPREVYFVDWDAVGDDDPACDIAFPIAD